MKKLFHTLVIATAAAVLLGTPSTSTAADKEKAKDKGGEKAKGGGGFTGKAVTVDKAAKTVKLSGEKGRTVQITATTRIMKDGKPATLDDLKEGDDVYGGLKPAGEGKFEATSLTIGKPPAKKKAEKKEEKK